MCLFGGSNKSSSFGANLKINDEIDKLYLYNMHIGILWNGQKLSGLDIFHRKNQMSLSSKKSSQRRNIMLNEIFLSMYVPLPKSKPRQS